MGEPPGGTQPCRIHDLDHLQTIYSSSPAVVRDCGGSVHSIDQPQEVGDTGQIMQIIRFPVGNMS